MKQMGVGLAVAVLLDATLIRGVLLPPAMKLPGHWNWKLPRWLEWLPRLTVQPELSEEIPESRPCSPPDESLIRVPLRLLGKGCRTSKRAEVVRLLVYQQATDRVLWIDRHLADGVDRQVIHAPVHANHGEDLDRLGDVAQDLPPARRIEHALEIRGERCRLTGDEYLAAGRERRHARRDVDCRSEVVAAALDSRSVVPADADGWRVVAAQCMARNPHAEPNCIGGIGHSQHERIADRLHVLAVHAWKLRLDDIRELLHELHGLLVSMRLGERREPAMSANKKVASASLDTA